MKPLYLGPKANVLLPFVQSRLRNIAAIVVAFFITQSASSQELVFQNPELINGIGKSDGSTYRFKTVANNIDALVKVVGRSDPKVKLKEIDDTNYGWNKSFQPLVEYNDGNVIGTVNWWMEFEIKFVSKGTSDPVNVQKFDITALDIDGDGAQLREYITFYQPRSYTLESSTHLNVTAVSDLLLGLLTSGVKFLGPIQNYVNIDTGMTSVMTSVNYQNVHKFNFRIGGVRTGSGSSSAGARMNSLWFRSFNYFSANLTLPIKLGSFNAALQNNRVQLSWITAQEKNVSHFTVERSMNGKDYKEAGLIFSDGNSEVSKSYAFADPVLGNPSVLYYRLRIVDLDGQIAYSPIRVVKLNSAKQKLELQVFPNPVSREVRITIPERWQNSQVNYELFDLAGSLMIRTINPVASQTESIDLQSFKSGIYLVRVSNGEEMMIQRIIKK